MYLGACSSINQLKPIQQFGIVRKLQSLMTVDAFGACDAMADRRQPITESEVSGDTDLWNEPAVGTIDTTVTVNTDYQPGFPSMCS
mmetsp:Transcript_27795/g.90424  ORF Transcript_27795/g.90424 Transcript_27795/m.90424 type:complete len:86 (+) Transcript_27795:270-527(+)